MGVLLWCKLLLLLPLGRWWRLPSEIYFTKAAVRFSGISLAYIGWNVDHYLNRLSKTDQSSPILKPETSSLLQTARLNTPLLCPSPHPICVSVCVCPEGLCSCICRVRTWRSVSWPANEQVSVSWQLSLVTSSLVVTCPVSCRRRMYLCV